MKVAILAGGFGTRLSEETVLRPKPLVDIGGRPIIWHIIKIYAHYNVTDVVVCLGYKGYMVKEYFANYTLHMSDVTFDMRDRQVEVHQTYAEPWRVTCINTGENVQTGGRILRARDYLGSDDFCLTYGDGVSDLNIRDLIAFHKSHGKLATVTAVQPGGRYGTLDLDGSMVSQFVEKPPGDGAWINGGFFIASPKILDYITGDIATLEGDVMPALAKDGQLMAFKHQGFWQAMDTLRDRNFLEAEWAAGQARWKIW
ncbi:MAG: glucose-1-phosphate cytidylyltransferase [Alphaproteobacteria bacterium]|nr:glucose-1-phosphate cytidylyltransferase [Alphaproteobacteria bacterium]